MGDGSREVEEPRGIETRRGAARRTSRRPTCVALVVACVLSASPNAAARAAAAEAEVRGAVEGAFRQLRGGDYGALYDALPAASRRRLTRARFVSALERARGLYELDRLEINAVRVAGELAVVDGSVYGRARAPFEAEGRIDVRQYLVREGGRWRVTTGDASTVRPLLAANPAFARKYPLTTPRLSVWRDGRWVEMGRDQQPARRQTKRKN